MKLVNLGELIRIISGFPFKSELFNEEGVGLPLIRVRDVNSGFAGIYYSGDYLEDYIINNGDVLIGMDGDFKVVEWKNTRALLNQRVCKLVPRHDALNKNYLLQFLPAALSAINAKTNFTTVKHLSTKTINDIQIPLPPLEDQKRIADLLNRAENLIVQRKESIKMLDELLKCTFLEMFGDPDIMKKMKHYHLGQYVDFITSGSRGWAQYYSQEGAIFLRINNVKNASLKMDDVICVNSPESAEAKRTKVQYNDLLLSITADLGRTAVVTKDLEGAYINQHLALIRLKKNIDLNPNFLAWYFYMPYGNSFIQRKNRKGVKAGLNFDDIKGLQIIKPDINTQNKYESVIKKVDIIKKYYEKNLIELKKYYESISQKAFKGELDLSGVDGGGREDDGAEEK